MALLHVAIVMSLVIFKIFTAINVFPVRDCLCFFN